MFRSPRIIVSTFALLALTTIPARAFRDTSFVLADTGRSSLAALAQAAQQPATVVFFGDSLTAGLHASQPDFAYRQILFNRIRDAVPAGESLAFIQDPFGLMDEALTKLPLVLAAKPSLVFVELGHHEIWADDYQVGLFEARYGEALDALLRSGADVIPSTLAWLGDPATSDPYRRSLVINDIIRRQAQMRGLVVAELWRMTDLRRELLSTPDDVSFISPYIGDDLHPNDEGHRLMAEAFWRAFRESQRLTAEAAARPR